MTHGERTRFKKVNEALVQAVPELRVRYESETAAWGEEMGPHVIYGDILNPYLSELLHAPNRTDVEEPLRRVFGFLEVLLADPDPEVANVAATTVADHLESDLEGLSRARQFMGPLTAQATGVQLD